MRKNEAAKQWLLRHPRVHFHYTPTHASWMNMIECFFSILTRRALTQSVQRSKKDLKDLLLRYLKKYSEDPTPFTWTNDSSEESVGECRLRKFGKCVI
jgi:transposase